MAHDENEQTRRWNGAAGRAWVDEQPVLDEMFEPLERLLVDAAVAASPESVLDVGCGTGATTLAIARQLGPTRRIVGIDLSEPMLTLAHRRAEADGLRATFIRGNAQDYPFEPESVDLIVSRFGVMFFDDPVRAFANMRGATRTGGSLRFIAWRTAAENPFMTTAEHAAASFLPDLPARESRGPGQFAFGDPQLVTRILENSGWAEIVVRPLDTECTFPVTALDRFITRLGPVGMILEDADGDTRARVTQTLRTAFEPYVDGDRVRFTAACWMVEARAHGQP